MAHFHRRQFLQNTGAVGLLSGAGALSALTQSGAYAADTSGYKALVCIFLFGGMDHADTVLPVDNASYNSLQNARPDLLATYQNGPNAGSRNIGNLLTLNPQNGGDFGSRRFGLPAQLGPLHALFESGDAALVGGVGPLVQPVTRTEIGNGMAVLPRRLFSHNDQQSTWLSLAPEGARSGWGGQFLDAAAQTGQGGRFSAITTGQRTSFLAGQSTRQFKISAGGQQEFRVISQNYRLGSGRNSDEARRLLRAHFASEGVNAENLFMTDVVNSNARAVENNGAYGEAIRNRYSFSTAFPASGLGRQLRSAAETISVQGALGVRRQIFFIGLGGFDTHNAQANALPGLHSRIADAVAAFHSAMGEINMNQNVTLFTASDFGRTLTDNGDGTDHGWGGHQFVVGGAVNGRRIYGDMPPIDLESENYTESRGRLIPSVSVDQYAATLGSWFGLDAGELANTFPNLANFSNQNLGFI